MMAIRSRWLTSVPLSILDKDLGTYLILGKSHGRILRNSSRLENVLVLCKLGVAEIHSLFEILRLDCGGDTLGLGVILVRL